MSAETRAEARARAASPGGWGKSGSAVAGPRYAKRRKGLRQRCGFCRGANRITYIGYANGVALCGGCELCIARWVKDGYDAFKHLDEPCAVCPETARYHNEYGCSMPGCRCVGYSPAEATP